MFEFVIQGLIYIYMCLPSFIHCLCVIISKNVTFLEIRRDGFFYHTTLEINKFYQHLYCTK